VSLEHLILLRHGETDWNAARRMQGQHDIDLNETGRQQAAAAAASVAALRPDVIVSSDLRRAVDTAAAVAAVAGLPVTTDPRLRETSLGRWEGITAQELVADWPAEWDRWRTGSAHFSPPEGESRWQVAQRGAEVVAELDAGTASRALLVAHGGFIVGVTGHLLGLPDDTWQNFIGVTNCHWSVLHRFRGRWRLHSWNAGLGAVVLPRGEDQVAGT
jgi:2,3-bisphosphoglycerate-dependent phosphoglycerate mutase/probable phosphoglycerate mutase